MAGTLPCLYQGHRPDQVWSINHPSVPLVPSPTSQDPCPGGFDHTEAPVLSILAPRGGPMLSCFSPALSARFPFLQPPSSPQELNPDTPDRGNIDLH